MSVSHYIKFSVNGLCPDLQLNQEMNNGKLLSALVLLQYLTKLKDSAPHSHTTFTENYLTQPRIMVDDNLNTWETLSPGLHMRQTKPKELSS